MKGKSFPAKCKGTHLKKGIKGKAKTLADISPKFLFKQPQEVKE